MMGCHKPDHMKTIGTSLQTGNHTNTQLYRLNVLPGAVKTLLSDNINKV